MSTVTQFPRDLKTNQNYDLLIVSDLHLSEGRHPATKKFSRNEDFFLDEEFARFLKYHEQHPRQPAQKWNLVINGDFFDFLQVVATDADEDFLQYLRSQNDQPAPQPNKHTARYGYGCGPIEGMYKLWRVMEGHWQFFEALADFLVQGNRVTIIRGNHDADFFYSEVQQAFRVKLRALFEAALVRRQDPEKRAKLQHLDAALTANALAFRDWFYYEENLIWVEHGNQYDSLNCFKDWLSPMLPKTDSARPNDLDLPWGSLFVRYLFNQVESSQPLADHIRPQTKFVAYYLAHQPFAALKFLVIRGGYMLVKMRRSWSKLAENAYAVRDQEQAEVLQQLTRDSGITPEQFYRLRKLHAPNILREEPDSRLWRMLRFLTRHRLMLPAMLIAYPLIVPILWVRSLFPPHEEPDALREKAEAIADILKVPYVVMGHTHDDDLHPLPATHGEYFNTGTWTKVFSEEEQLMGDESELVFAQGTREEGRLKMHLMKWNDATGEPRLVRLLETEEERKATLAQTTPAPQVPAHAAVAD